MMSLTAGVQAAIDSGNTQTCMLVRIDLATPIYICDHYQDLSWDGKTWDSSIHLSRVGDIAQAQLTKNTRVNIGLLGVDQTYYSTFLSNDFINRHVYIYLAFFDSDGVLIPDPVQMHYGRIVDCSFADNPQTGSAAVSLVVGGPFDDFNKKAGRMTNTTSQSEYFPGDLGFEYAGQAAKSDKRWGG